MLKEKTTLPEIEEKVLKFWDECQIFEKSIEKRKRKKSFAFYDGPPFATGLPHYGHILATTIKDSVTRFWTMRGFKVERRVGWDCHGLPVENLIEKELGLKDKKEIEAMGMEKFNNACRAAVFRSVGDFQKTLKRVGRWADYSNSYATLDNSYMESVWWVFKKLWEQDLVYSDYRVSPYCPRCGTPLSNFEVNQGYKDTEDPAVYVKFELKRPDVPAPTYFVAWTTTPWTLTANAALAVRNDITYAKVARQTEKGEEILIIAKERVEKVMEEEKYEILSEIKGESLVGMEYKPMFSFIEPEGKAHRVIHADYVSTEDGSGIVHIAPAFGAEDMEAAKRNGIQMILTVDEQGKMKDEVTPWAGQFVKKADKGIIEYLKETGILFKEEKITHSYPFCWRCDTPLLYYPIDGFYVSVTKLKEDLLSNNDKIRWVPGHIKSGRFGKWLADARDWAISRNRFWGAPLPVWRCDYCGHDQAIGGLEELSKAAVSSGNKYWIVRHSEADSNVLNVLSSFPEKTPVSLTPKGLKEAEAVGKKLKKSGVDIIYSSPLKRTLATAEAIAKETGAELRIDERIKEYDFGVMNGMPVEDFEKFIESDLNKFHKAPEGGETITEVRKRMVDFFYDIDSKDSDKKIVIVSHGDPLWVLEGTMKGMDDKALVEERKKLIYPGEVREMRLARLPINTEGKIDLHRPFIDSIEAKCPKCGGKAKRINQVFDCWFESGAMPYASWHYPFENKEKVESIFPADFIAEGLDQTRGWFYTLHVLGTALTRKNIGLGKGNPAFKNVIVNGLVLDEVGRKLSKKLRNYTEPELIFDKFGADAMRFFLLSSTAIGEDYRFADKGVAETKIKVMDRLVNSFNFLRMYSEGRDMATFFTKEPEKLSVIDKWIKARLKQTIIKMTDSMEIYQLTDATRPMIDFLDDLSNWYIRRSRTRLQRPDSLEDYYAAAKTLYDCLLDSAKLIAPFSPFIAEALYLSLTDGKHEESVHLEDWPVTDKKMSKEETDLIADMVVVRDLCAKGLALRNEAAIKVKQPLMSFKFTEAKMKGKTDLMKLVEEEVNVKRAFHEVDAGEGSLDLTITADLRDEGLYREAVRMIQDLRQKADLNPGEKAEVFLSGSKLERIFSSRKEETLRILSASSIQFKKSDLAKAFIETTLDEEASWIGVRKS